jgi:hypothetical protein
MVTLHDGREVPSDSEEWRAECEARYLLNRPTIDERRALLAAIEKRRGKKAREDLEQRALAIWRKK